MWEVVRRMHVLSSAVKGGSIHIEMGWNRWLNGRGTLDVCYIEICTALMFSVAETL